MDVIVYYRTRPSDSSYSDQSLDEQRVPVHRWLTSHPAMTKLYTSSRRQTASLVRTCERIAEWIRETLHITGVQPNHGWHHLFVNCRAGPR